LLRIDLASKSVSAKSNQQPWRDFKKTTIDDEYITAEDFYTNTTIPYILRLDRITGRLELGGGMLQCTKMPENLL
jgi:hypothetical protein